MRCMNCGAAPDVAPGQIVERDGQSVLARQAASDDEIVMAQRARLLCPTASIRSESHVAATPEVFPQPLTDAVFWLGYNATALAYTARAEAKKANRAKSECLARMSHELRTPLNAVIGFGQLDLGCTLTAQQKGYSQDIVRSGEHLLKLVNEVLDLAGVESGQMPVSLERLMVADVLTDVAEIMMPVEVKAGVMLTVESATDLSAIRADALRLRQALLNLVANAIKYNHRGGAVPLSSLTIDDRFRLVMADTGCGIPATRQAELFEPFHRPGAEYTAVEGTGLGLALAKRLVEAMGFASAVGKGSSFWIEFPRDTAKPGARSAGQRRGRTPPRSPEIGRNTDRR